MKNDIGEKATYTVEEVQRILRISRTKAYRLIKENLFVVVVDQGCYRINKASFDKWLDGQDA